MASTAFRQSLLQQTAPAEQLRTSRKIVIEICRQRSRVPEDPDLKISAQRIGDAPIIRPHMDKRMGDNVNGPSLIRVPDWLPNPLGKYYLYFAHHDGQYIRLAYADDLRGPWQTVESGVLPLADSLFRGHIASPDVIVDSETKTLRLYYHGADEPTANNAPQVTRVATSRDGINFQAHAEVLGQPYMRVFRYQDWHYAIAMPGILYRSIRMICLGRLRSACSVSRGRRF